MFHHRQLIKDASIFRLCTAVDHTTHRVQRLRPGVRNSFLLFPRWLVKGWALNAHHPFLTSLFCRFWLHACSGGPFPEIPLPFDACNQRHIAPLFWNKTLTHCPPWSLIFVPNSSPCQAKSFSTFCLPTLVDRAKL